MTNNTSHYAHMDIDTFNSQQLYFYGIGVSFDAIELIKAAGGSMTKIDLICALKQGALGPSEISFALMIGRDNGMLHMKWQPGVGTVVGLGIDD